MSMSSGMANVQHLTTGPAARGPVDLVPGPMAIGSMRESGKRYGNNYVYIHLCKKKKKRAFFMVFLDLWMCKDGN